MAWSPLRRSNAGISRVANPETTPPQIPTTSATAPRSPTEGVTHGLPSSPAWFSRSQHYRSEAFFASRFVRDRPSAPAFRTWAADLCLAESFFAFGAVSDLAVAPWSLGLMLPERDAAEKVFSASGC